MPMARRMFIRPIRPRGLRVAEPDGADRFPGREQAKETSDEDQG